MVDQGSEYFHQVVSGRNGSCAKSNAHRAISNKLAAQASHGQVICLLAALFLLLTLFAPKASAEIVQLDGVITDGEFLSPQFVEDPSQPGGGSTQLVDQLGLTGTSIVIALDFDNSVLNDPLEDGYSFLILNDQGEVTGSNLSITGTLGDPSMGGLVFENELRTAGQRAIFENGVLNIEFFVTGDNDAVPFLGTSPTGLLQLMSAMVPASVQTVGDLVEFLNVTSLFSTGSLPVEFFVSSGSGDIMLVNTDITFNVNSVYADPSAVPVPGAVWLFLSGLAGFGWVMRRTTTA